MYTVETINENSFVIKRDGVPLLSGPSLNYYIQKEDVFSLSITSVTNPKDTIRLSILEVEDSTNIVELFFQIASGMFGPKVANVLKSLSFSTKIYMTSVGSVFILAKCDTPFYCGPKNTLITRTKEQKVQLLEGQTLRLIQEFSKEDAGVDDILDVYNNITNELVSTNPLDFGGLNYLGTWDASTNTPDIFAIDPRSGDYFKISVAGTIKVDDVSEWNVGDWAIFNGDVWEKIDQTELVLEVNGQTGSVVLDADDIDDTSTTNKFVTAADLTTLSNTSGVNSGDEQTFSGTSGDIGSGDGLVPDDGTPSTGTRYLADDGTWKTPSGGAVDSVNGQTGVVVLDADDLDDDATSHKFVTAADLTTLSNTSGTNSGDEVQSTESVAGIAEIADSTEMSIGTNDSTIVTPLKLKNRYGVANGIAPLNGSTKLYTSYLEFAPSFAFATPGPKGYYSSTVSTTYEKIGQFLVRDLNPLDITSILANIWTNSTADFKIEDVGRVTTIVEVTGVTASVVHNITNMGTILSTLTGDTVCAIYGRVPGGSGEAFCASVVINFS